MIKKPIGNILNATEDIICQQVNCKGVMGAGLAKQIADKYSNVYSEYKKLCDLNYAPSGSLLGYTLFVEPVKEGNPIVACLFSQDNYGRSNKLYTNYNAFTNALMLVKQYAEGNGYSVAIPYGIGCGLGNGDWKIIYNIIRDIFDNYDVSIYRLKK